MEATIRKDDGHRVTLILDGRLDTSVTPQTEKEVEPLFRCCANHCDLFIKGLREEVYDVFQTTGFVHLFQFK